MEREEKRVEGREKMEGRGEGGSGERERERRKGEGGE